jgi:hypothetical protein
MTANLHQVPDTELAAWLAGLDPALISRFENYNTSLSNDSQRKIERALGLTFAELLPAYAAFAAAVLAGDDGTDGHAEEVSR